MVSEFGGSKRKVLKGKISRLFDMEVTPYFFLHDVFEQKQGVNWGSILVAQQTQIATPPPT